MKKIRFSISGIIPKFIWILLLSSFSTLNLDAQTTILNRHCPDYPAGTICSACDADDTCSTFILPPAKYNQPYTITIPLLVDFPDLCVTNNHDYGNSEIEENYTLTNIDNTINLLVTSWDTWSGENWISFNFHVEEVGCNIANQVYTIPLMRDTVKIVLALGISESMASNISGTTNTCIDEMKDAVNILVSKLEQFRQEGDSIGLTYYNTEVIQPNSTDFPKDFIELTDWSSPIEDFSSVKINNDLTPRTPEGMAAMGEGLLNTKNKLINGPSNSKKIVFLFSDGLQNSGNQLNLNGISYNGSLDSLNNNVVNSNDSITYITISTAQAANVPPLMSAIAYKNNGASLYISETSSEYQSFLNSQLDNILCGDRPTEVATRIMDLNPRNDSLYIEADQNLRINFNEIVNINTGSIFIMSSFDDSEFEEIDVTSGLVLGNGTSIITVNPIQDLESETEYYILIDENAFMGVSGNSFAGITSSNYWTFTSEDAEKPSVILTTDNDTTNTAEFDTYVNFSERIHGFSDSKISVTNGNVSSLSTTDSIDFIASVTALSQGETDININANQVTDSAGNMNTAAEELIVTYYIPTNIEVLEEAGISIYTSKGYVIVEFTKPNSLDFRSANIEIYSLNGSLVKKESLENNSGFRTYLNDQRRIYLVKLTLDRKVYYAKIQN